MGYMTTIMILNDGFDQIEKNPEEFISKLKEGMLGINRYNRKQKNINEYGVGNHANVIQVVQSHHADDPRMFISFQNSIEIVGWGNDSTQLEYRKRLLKIAKDMIKQKEEEIKRMELESKYN